MHGKVGVVVLSTCGVTTLNVTVPRLEHKSKSVIHRSGYKTEVKERTEERGNS